jgi:iron complex outermembrane receptor protein
MSLFWVKERRKLCKNTNSILIVKVFVAFICATHCFLCYAFVPISDTVVRLRSVEIKSGKCTQFVFAEQTFGSNALQNSMADFYVKNYGIGQLSSISFRGMPSEHTDVMWNGISIKSPMHQLYDLSLAPSSDISQIQFIESNTSNQQTGQLHIQRKKTDFSLFSNAISHHSNGLFQNSLNTFFNIKKNKLWVSNEIITGANDYKYQNQFLEYRNLPNNNIYQTHTIVDGVFNMNKGRALNYGLWYLNSDRDIPPTRSTNISNQSIKDENLRIYMGLNIDKTVLKTSFHHENQNYKDIDIQLHATHIINSIRNTIQSEIVMDSNRKLIFENYNNIYNISSSSYKNPFYFWDIQSSLQFEQKFKRNYSLNLSLNHMMNSQFFALPRVSFMLNKKTGAFTHQFCFKNSVRLPTTNELFWNPGGNSLLKPENAFQWNLQTQYQKRTNYFKLSVFYHWIQDRIVWQPTSQANVWSPINLNQVQNLGVHFQSESKILSFHNITLKYIPSIQWMHSKVNQEASQIYTPQWKSIHSIKMNYKNVSFDFNINYTSRRYTTMDNSEYLPHYFIISSWTQYDFKAFKKFNGFLRLAINNLTNINYQEIENRAMPLRNYILTLQIQK